MVDSLTKQWVMSVADEHAVRNGCWFDEAAADHVCNFFEMELVHYEGRWAGKPFGLIDWQRVALSQIYGWKDSDGDRRFRDAYLEICKKNGKSPIGSGCFLYHLVGDEEPGARVFASACDIKQADVVYGTAECYVAMSPSLTDQISMTPSKKHMYVPRTRSTGDVCSKVVDAKDGLNASFVVIDELHRQKDRRLWDIFEHAGAARRQFLRLTLTTAGDDRDTICWEVHEHALNVIAGTKNEQPFYDDSFYALVHAAPDDADWTDRAVWKQANPSLGVILREKELEQAFAKALRSPASENLFRRLRLNQWVKTETAFVHMQYWDACLDESLTASSLIGRPCFAALDLSVTTDLSSLSLVFHEDGYATLTFAWIPRETAKEHERVDNVPYTEWARSGELRLTSGTRVNYDQIEDEVIAMSRLYDIQRCGFDAWGAEQLVQKLNRNGIPMVAFPQNFKHFAAPTAELKRRIIGGEMRHDGNRVLRSCISNMRTIMDNHENEKPVKGKSVGRIDCGVSLIMALGMADTAPEPEAESAYNTGAELFVIGGT